MKITSIRATSRASVKVNDSLDDTDNVEEERKKLWDICNNETDSQIEDILKSFSKR